jgi:hypothetical protein
MDSWSHCIMCRLRGHLWCASVFVVVGAWADGVCCTGLIPKNGLSNLPAFNQTLHVRGKIKIILCQHGKNTWPKVRNFVPPTMFIASMLAPLASRMPRHTLPWVWNPWNFTKSSPHQSNFITSLDFHALPNRCYWIFWVSTALFLSFFPLYTFTSFEEMYEKIKKHNS